MTRVVPKRAAWSCTDMEAALKEAVQVVKRG